MGDYWGRICEQAKKNLRRYSASGILCCLWSSLSLGISWACCLLHSYSPLLLLRYNKKVGVTFDSTLIMASQFHDAQDVHTDVEKINAMGGLPYSSSPAVNPLKRLHNDIT